MYGISYKIPYITERHKMTKENKTFVITYTKLDGESVTRNGKWTDKCKEFVAKQGHKCLTYIDIDNNDEYRMATNQITDWNIKWN